MPQSTFTQDGVVYEDMGNGQVRVVGYADASRGGTIIPKAVDPKQPYEIQRLQGEVAAQQRTAQTAPYDARKAAADAQKAEAEARIATGKATAELPTNPLLATAIKRLQNDELLGAIANARREINSGILPTTGFGSGVARAIGGTSANDLQGSLITIGSAVTLSKLGELKQQSATGASGLGALSEKEAAYLESSIASLNTNQSKAKLLDSLARIETHYRRLNALAEGSNPDKPEVAKAYGLVSDPPPKNSNGLPGAQGGGSNGTGPDGYEPGYNGITNQGKSVKDPALAGANARVVGLIKSGASADEIRGYLDQLQPGLGGRTLNLDAWVQFHAQHPDRPIAVNVEETFKPNSEIGKALGGAALTPLGTGIVNAADAVTAGNLDSLTANPALTRAAIGGISQQNPGAAFAGDLVGSATGAGLAEFGAGRLGLQGINALRAGDLGYGAAYGAGTNDDNRLGGAALGAVTGGLGGMFGRGTAKALGTLASGVGNAETRYLNAAGVPLTVGQALGGTVKAVEDRLSGFPLVGDAINARRREGITAFNKAAFNEGLGPVGGQANGIGEAGIVNAQQSVSDAYGRALDGRQFTADPQFVSDIGAARQAGSAIPQLGDQFVSMVDNRVGSLFDNNGNITGRGFQDAVRGVRQGVGSARNEIMGHEFGQAGGQIDDALRGLVHRQAPDVLPQYDAANQAYGNLSTLEDAVLRGKNTDGVFTPAQLGMASVANTTKFGGKKAAAAGERPFFELQRAAQNVQPSKIPDSGTAGRYIIPASLGIASGAGGAASTSGDYGDRAQNGAAVGVTAALLAAAPYSKNAQRLLVQSLIHERPAAIKGIGDVIGQRARIGGMFGAPLGLQYGNGVLLGGNQ